MQSGIGSLSIFLNVLHYILNLHSMFFSMLSSNTQLIADLEHQLAGYFKILESTIELHHSTKYRDHFAVTNAVSRFLNTDQAIGQLCTVFSIAVLHAKV